MLRIQLRKQPSGSGSGAGASSAGGAIKSLPVDTVTVACPDHLVLADLPVAKGVGAATFAANFKSLGRRSRRQLGERVHFCVRCDFPIAMYGRLTPCEHAFCLDCARSDSKCYLCDERIQKIQTIKMMEGIFVCAAPHCLKSFLKRSDFEAHIYANHGDLLHSNADKEDGNEQEVQSAKQPTPSESRAPPRPIISPASNSQLLDEEKARWQQPPRQMMQPRPPFLGQAQNYSSDTQPECSRPLGFDRQALQTQFQQSMQGTPQQDSGQFTDRQQGSFPEAATPEYPTMRPIQPQNFGMPMNATSFMAPQFGHAPFQPEGAQPFYSSPYEMGQNQMVRTDSVPDLVSEPGPPALGFPPGPASSANFMANYPQPWSIGGAPSGQGNTDGFGKQSDSHGNMAYHRGDYSQNPGGLAPPMLSGNKGMEPGSQVGNSMDPRDGKGTFPLQPFTNVPPPTSLPHPSQQKRHNYFSNDMGHDGQGF